MWDAARGVLRFVLGAVLLFAVLYVALALGSAVGLGPRESCRDEPCVEQRQLYEP